MPQILGKEPGEAKSEGPARSPGAAPRHYAPETPLKVVCEAKAAELLQEYRDRPVSAAVLCRTGECEQPVFASAFLLEVLPIDPLGYAAGLYAALHHLDDLAVDQILVIAPPGDGAWAAVRDRLARAAVRPN